MALKAGLEKDPTDGWIIGLNDVATLDQPLIPMRMFGIGAFGRSSSGGREAIRGANPLPE